MLDEWTDILNKEQLSLWLCTVDNDFNANDYFFAFDEIANLKVRQ